MTVAVPLESHLDPIGFLFRFLALTGSFMILTVESEIGLPSRSESTHIIFHSYYLIDLMVRCILIYIKST
jgi:hypothetical protein